MTMKRVLKKLILGEGRRPRRIPAGLYRGLTLSIDAGSEAMFYAGLYEAETNHVLRRFIAKARCLLDVGAACGELTAWALRSPRIERVLAYDVSPQRWPVFHENMRLNGFDGDERLAAVEGWFLPDGEPPESVERFFAELPEPIMVKIDVDGGEGTILQRMADVLRKHDCLVLLETHSKDLDEYCFGVLCSAGYRCERIAPAWWRRFIPERRPIEFNQWIAAEKPSRR